MWHVANLHWPVSALPLAIKLGTDFSVNIGIYASVLGLSNLRNHRLKSAERRFTFH